jgi:hypothetical protein
MTPSTRAKKVYNITQKLSNPNALAQAGSGIIGMGLNVLVDLFVLPLYAKMWDDIREVYGHGVITKKAAIAYLKPNINYIAHDLLFDKICGTVPLVGISFNYIYAKALTWRLGAWFGLLSALAKANGTDNIPDELLTKCSFDLVRKFFPRENIEFFEFKEPDKDEFIEFIANLETLEKLPG